jgi:hypothetical protein
VKCKAGVGNAFKEWLEEAAQLCLLGIPPPAQEFLLWLPALYYRFRTPLAMTFSS